MKRLLPLLIGFYTICSSHAQEATLRGTVIDSLSREPVIGVNVTYAPGKGAATDPSGKYSIALPAGDHEITFSFVGYTARKQRVAISPGETRELNISISLA
ncbi:MAG: carboxypeptidase-like regulatory domain-containing protein, partial [Bacteroidota bacterium]|nr:carboxypeptidase-like regulatory domain-containing protein [Bacteroidota bacterium]